MSMQTEKPRTSRSLAATLAITFLALSAAVLLVATGFQIFFNIQAQQEAVANRQRLIAQGAANTVSGFMQEKFGKLEGPAKLGSPLFMPQDEQRNMLSGLLSLDPGFRHLVLLDSQGQELAKSARISEVAAGNLVDRAEGAFEQVQQGERYVGSVYVDEQTSEPMVVIAVPITNVFGDFQGALLAEVNLKFMWDLVDRLQIGETGLAYVVNRQGRLIAFGDVTRVLRGEDVKHLREVSEFVSSTALVDETGANISSGINGTNVVSTYVPLGVPDWAVVVELPVVEAYRPVIQSAALSAGVMLVMAVVAGLLGVYVARRLAAPLLALTETAGRIAGGEVGLQANMEGPAETVGLAQAFNSMTAQLRELIGSLEARTRALETSTQVSRRLSTILDREQLVAEVVQQVRDAFDYYHTHIYLIDEATQDLVMTGGTGEAGRTMLASGHRIPWGKGLTGRAAATNSVVLVPDVSQEESWLPNPLLPETKSEVAVPIAVGERVLGVLDVQHDVVGGLSATDADMLQAIANQVAIALQNAGLFTEARQRAEHQALVNLITQRIQSTTTVENALQVAVRELGRALGAQRASVQLEPTSDEDR